MPDPTPVKKIPLASFLAKTGLASRRSSQKFIVSGDISINGSIVRELSTAVDPDNDTVCYKNTPLELEIKRYFLLHKPIGYICTAKDKHASKVVYDLIPKSIKQRLFSIGRLDKDSEGLLLLTNDGDLANRLTHPRYQIKKTYRVNVVGRVRSKDLNALKRGIKDGGELLTAHSVEIIERKTNEAVLQITVCEGRKREIRRMCDAIGLKVRRLLRTSFGPLELGEFKNGFLRELTRDEVTSLNQDSIIQ